MLAGLLLVSVLALSASPASASTAPPENPGCETYGCLYEHCTPRMAPGTCPLGIAYQRLPDGPGNRHFLRVLWPGHYASERRGMWDQVAQCESTWRWDYNGRSGFDGGVQFHPRTWNAYGGGEFAQYAWQARPEQQIAVAERLAYYGWQRPDGVVVQPQGPRAWPRCGYVLRYPG